jgi:hypothetical protein
MPVTNIGDFAGIASQFVTSPREVCVKTANADNLRSGDAAGKNMAGAGARTPGFSIGGHSQQR